MLTDLTWQTRTMQAAAAQAQLEASGQQIQQLQTQLHEATLKLQQAEEQTKNALSQCKAQLTALQQEHSELVAEAKREAGGQLQQNLQGLQWELQTAKVRGWAAGL